MEFLERSPFGKLCTYFWRLLMMSPHIVIFTVAPKALSADRNSYATPASNTL